MTDGGGFSTLEVSGVPSRRTIHDSHHRNKPIVVPEAIRRKAGLPHGKSGRRGLRPIIFVLDNSGYLIERVLCKDPGIAGNDVAPWRYGAASRAWLRRLVWPGPDR